MRLLQLLLTLEGLNNILQSQEFLNNQEHAEISRALKPLANQTLEHAQICSLLSNFLFYFLLSLLMVLSADQILSHFPILADVKYLTPGAGPFLVPGV